MTCRSSDDGFESLSMRRRAATVALNSTSVNFAAGSARPQPESYVHPSTSTQPASNHASLPPPSSHPPTSPAPPSPPLLSPPLPSHTHTTTHHAVKHTLVHTSAVSADPSVKTSAPKTNSSAPEMPRPQQHVKSRESVPLVGGVRDLQMKGLQDSQFLAERLFRSSIFFAISTFMSSSSNALRARMVASSFMSCSLRVVHRGRIGLASRSSLMFSVSATTLCTKDFVLGAGRCSPHTPCSTHERHVSWHLRDHEVHGVTSRTFACVRPASIAPLDAPLP